LRRLDGIVLADIFLSYVEVEAVLL
jgi:hypothetical protein